MIHIFFENLTKFLKHNLIKILNLLRYPVLIKIKFTSVAFKNRLEFRDWNRDGSPSRGMN